MRRQKLLIVMAVLFAACVVLGSSSSTNLKGSPMRWPNRSSIVAMTFNIRTSSALDGLNSWEFRRPLVEEVIREQAPDIIALQEPTLIQIWNLANDLPGYTIVTMGAGNQQINEYPAIMYRTDRFADLTSAGFWLSDTPSRPDSRSWGNWKPRGVTEVTLQERSSGLIFRAASVHLDYQSENSRQKSVAMLKARYSKVAKKPVVLMGDFNDNPDSLVLSEFTNGVLYDTFLESSDKPRGTLHGFSGLARNRYDMILVSEDWEVQSSKVLEYHLGRRYPSDHFPVIAEISIKVNTDRGLYCQRPAISR